MTHRFAKLFEVSEVQLLVYLEADSEDDDALRVNRIVEFEGAQVNHALTGVEHELAHEYLDTMTEEAATELADELKAIIVRLTTKQGD